MSREWQVGNVALTGEGRISIVANARCDTHVLSVAHWHHPDGRYDYLDTVFYGFGEARPLVVIDPEDDGIVSQLWRLLPSNLVSIDQLQAALREFADPKPPKPDEPTGHLAIVEDTHGIRWVSWRDLRDGMTTHERPWQSSAMDTEDWRDYRDIDVANVLFEGVTP